MPKTERHLRYGWILPDQPNQIHGSKSRDLDEALSVAEDGLWVDGARLIDLGDSYHGQHVLMGVWWQGRFIPTREYFIDIFGRLPSGNDELFETLIREGGLSVLI